MPVSSSLPVNYAGRDYGEKFFWILGGILKWVSGDPFKCYIIPSLVMPENVSAYHWK